MLCLGLGGGSHTLQGLIDYLSEYFNVTCLELPGLGGAEKPLNQVSIDNFILNFADRLKKIKFRKLYFSWSFPRF